MKHLVLGSSGQVGGHLVSHLKGLQGHTVERFDIADGIGFDLRKTSSLLAHAVLNADYVHFLAFDVGGSHYLAKRQDSYAFISNNIKLMDHTFDVLAEAGTPFYFASSQMSTMSHSTYGKLKAIGEAYTSAIGGLNLHFWNIYGYESDPEKSHVVTDFIRMALDHGEITMRTTGTEERNLLYGDDAARMLVEVTLNHDWLRENLTNTPIPITNQDWISIKDVAGCVARVAGKKTRITPGFNSDKVQGIKNEVNAALHALVLERLRFSPDSFTSLEDGVRHVLKQMKRANKKFRR